MVTDFMINAPKRFYWSLNKSSKFICCYKHLFTPWLSCLIHMKFTSAILRTDYLCADSIRRSREDGSVNDNGCRCNVLLVYANSKLSDIGYRWEIYVNPRFTLPFQSSFLFLNLLKLLFDTYFVFCSLCLRFLL